MTKLFQNKLWKNGKNRRNFFLYLALIIWIIGVLCVFHLLFVRQYQPDGSIVDANLSRSSLVDLIDTQFWRKHLGEKNSPSDDDDDDRFHRLLIRARSTIFVLEPAILRKIWKSNLTGTTVESGLGDDDNNHNNYNYQRNAKSRFERSNYDSLTVGTFVDDAHLAICLIKSNNFHETYRVTTTSTQANQPNFDAERRFNESNKSRIITHIWFRSNNSFSNRTIEKLQSPPTEIAFRSLTLHLVIVFPYQHFVWIGPLVTRSSRKIRKDINLNLQFARQYSQIFDRFEVITLAGIGLPDDVEHLLRQSPTSRYLSNDCDTNVKCDSHNRCESIFANDTKSMLALRRKSAIAFDAMKRLMRSVRIAQYWISAGTLLGWYRQCDIIPYTTDTDFATWQRYVTKRTNQNDTNKFTARLRVAATSRVGNGFSLRTRFGRANDSLEYSFSIGPDYAHWKIDLFFTYRNETHYRNALHRARTNQFAYLAYPPFQLCSVQLLGRKLLAPCKPEAVIVAEYGAEQWRHPNPDWIWDSSSRNMDPWNQWQRDELDPVSQYEMF